MVIHLVRNGDILIVGTVEFVKPGYPLFVCVRSTGRAIFLVDPTKNSSCTPPLYCLNFRSSNMGKHASNIQKATFLVFLQYVYQAEAARQDSQNKQLQISKPSMKLRLLVTVDENVVDQPETCHEVV
jgi:hypothetical protein